jgi:hypothetical protein
MPEFIKFEKGVPKYLTMTEGKGLIQHGDYEGKSYVYFTWQCEQGTVKATEKLNDKMKALNLVVGDKIVIEKRPHPTYTQSVFFTVERYTQQKDTEPDTDLKEAEKTPPTGDLAKLIAELEHLVDKYKVPF